LAAVDNIDGVYIKYSVTTRCSATTESLEARGESDSCHPLNVLF
jgi:hypothetical protein